MISIKKYNHKMKNIWDDFIDCSNNGTLFHKQSFLEYHQTRSFADHSMLFYSNNILIAVLPAALNDKNKTLHSHPGASFGGLVVLDRASFKLIQEILVALEEYLKKLGINLITLIVSPLIYFHNQEESLNYLLYWNKYQVIEQYISHYSLLDKNYCTDPLINKRKKRYIKKIIDNNLFTIIKTGSLGAFYKLLVQSKKQYKLTPTHSLQELRWLQKTFPNKIELFISKYGERVSGGTLLFYLNSKTCLVFYNVVDKKYKKNQLSSYQLYNAMNEAKKRGCNFIDFGVSHNPEKNNPLSPKYSLIRFKEQFNARGCIRTVYQKGLNDK